MLMSAIECFVGRTRMLCPVSTVTKSAHLFGVEFNGLCSSKIAKSSKATTTLRSEWKCTLSSTEAQASVQHFRVAVNLCAKLLTPK